jgi:condensation domain-containing protein
MIADRFAATHGQAAIWFADQAIGPTSAYSVVVRATVRGAVGDRVRRACDALPAAVPATRLRLGLDAGGGLVQWFDDGPLAVDRVHLATDGGDLDEVVRDWVVATPFESDGGSLFRVLCVETAPELTVVVLSGHHTVLDGISQSILAATFVSCLTGDASPQPAGRYRSLVEHVRADEQRALADDLAAQVWLLETVRPIGPDEADWSGGGSTAAEGHRRRAVDVATAQRAVECARWLGVSGFSVSLAWVGLAFARTGLTRSVVCAATSSRPRGVPSADVVGCFVNQVPLVSRHEPGQNVADVVAANATGWRDALRRRLVPLPAVVNRVRGAGLDHAFMSFRAARAVQRHRCPDGVTVETDVFHVYPERKSDLSVRFMGEDSALDYDVEWNRGAPERLGPAFATALADVLADPVVAGGPS